MAKPKFVLTEEELKQVEMDIEDRLELYHDTGVDLYNTVIHWKKVAEAKDTELKRVRKALRVVVILPDFDCPGDKMEHCGFECFVCKSTWVRKESHNQVKHNGVMKPCPAELPQEPDPLMETAINIGREIDEEGEG